MQYELYIDVFFLINFMMDYILLRLLNKMLSCTATHGRMIAGALMGAILTCVVIILPIPYAFIKLLMFHGLVNVVMLKIGLRIKWDRSFLKAFLFLYIGGFLLGGIMGSLKQYLRAGSLFFALSMLGYCIASGVWSLIVALSKHRHTYCAAVLKQGEKCCQVNALIDTGNRLRNSVSQKPVSIIGEDTAKLLGIDRIEEFSQNDPVHFISYQSVGKASGVLPVYVLDRMLLTVEGKDIEIVAPEIAVSKEVLNGEDYKMILNPDVYNGL
ncbi:MAG: sigma-E processing peptidase SpoIIGA [Lachnospiraceae bacterium]